MAKSKKPLPPKTAELFDACISARRAKLAAGADLEWLIQEIAEALGAEMEPGPHGVRYALPSCPHCGRVTYISEQLGKVEAYTRGSGSECAATAEIGEYVKQELARRRQS